MAWVAFGAPRGEMQGSATTAGVGSPRSSARTPQVTPRRPNPKGARDLRPSSALLGDEAEGQLQLRPERLDLGRNCRARGPSYYSDGLLIWNDLSS